LGDFGNLFRWVLRSSLTPPSLSPSRSCSSSPASWAPKGRRARSSVLRNWGTNVTLLASITANGMGPSLAVEGATTREVFEAYLERFLVPSLGPGQVVVMDDLSVHKGGRVRS
jgi:hypothetical protein